MKLARYLVCGAAALAAAWAARADGPSVDNVRLAQDASGLVTITYDLADAPAIVLVDIEKDGQSIGACDPADFVGDVSSYATRIVQPGTDRTVRWNPAKAFPSLKGSVTAVVRAWPTDEPPDILVVDLASGTMQYFASTNGVPGEGNVQNALYKTKKMAFRRIPAGGVKWRMGSDGTAGSAGKETKHMVTLTKDFYLGIYECTQAQYHEVSPGTKCATYTTQGEMRPCDTISYYWIRGVDFSKDSYLGLLRSRTDGLLFDLPTEAQWEYACRGGSLNNYYAGAYNETTAKLIARYGQNSGKIATGDKVPTVCDPSQATAIVGSYLPNAFGLYDMLGNVLERCRDRYVADLGSADVENPLGTSTESTFTIRGGCWRDPYNYLSASSRGGTGPNDTYQSRGFRVALDLGHVYACTNPDATVSDTSIPVPTRGPAAVKRSTAADVSAVAEESVAVAVLEARTNTSAASDALEEFLSTRVGGVIILR